MKNKILNNFVFIHFTYMIVSWTALIYVKRNYLLTINTEVENTLFYTLMKLIIWILPLLIFMHYKSHIFSLQDLNFRRPISSIQKGLTIGSLIALPFLLIDVFIGSTFHFPEISPAFISAVIFTPFFEEFIFRGFYLHFLFKQDYPKRSAIFITSIFFVFLHFPGWLALQSQGELEIAKNTLVIFILGILWAIATLNTRSSITAVTMHFINNFYSSFVF